VRRVITIRLHKNVVRLGEWHDHNIGQFNPPVLTTFNIPDSNPLTLKVKLNGDEKPDVRSHEAAQAVALVEGDETLWRHRDGPSDWLSLFCVLPCPALAAPSHRQCPISFARHTADLLLELRKALAVAVGVELAKVPTIECGPVAINSTLDVHRLKNDNTIHVTILPWVDRVMILQSESAAGLQATIDTSRGCCVHTVNGRCCDFQIIQMKMRVHVMNDNLELHNELWSSPRPAENRTLFDGVLAWCWCSIDDDGGWRDMHRGGGRSWSIVRAQLYASEDV
jgi:hypothetical protein